MSANDDNTVNPQLTNVIDCLYRLSVKAIIIENHKILLVSEQRAKWWSLPGGGVDYGESVQEALKRELFEELGIVPEATQVDEGIRFVATNVMIDSIPRAVLVCTTHISSEAKPTSHVKDYAWYSKEKLSGISLSPSVGPIIKELTI